MRSPESGSLLLYLILTFGFSDNRGPAQVLSQLPVNHSASGGEINPWAETAAVSTR
jgi:hypothetical protein